MKNTFTRRDFLKVMGVSASAAVLAACAPKIDVSQYEAGNTNTNTNTQSGGSSNAGTGTVAAPTGGDTAAAPAELTYAAGTTLRMATGYNSAKTGITFDAESLRFKIEE